MESGKGEEAGQFGADRAGAEAGIERGRRVRCPAPECRARESALWSAPFAIAMADLEGRLTYANPAFARLWAYDTPGECLGRPVTAFWQDPEAGERIRRAVLGDGQWIGERVGRRRDGEPVCVRFSAHLVRDDDGAPVTIMATFVDLTDRIRAEQALRAWERRYAAAIDATGLVLYDWDPEAGTVTYGGRLVALTGHRPDELGPDPENWMALVHPDDREMLEEARARLLSEGVPLSLEYRVRRQGDVNVLVHDEGRLVEGGDGGGRRVVGFVRDITAQQRLEEQLRQSQKLEAIGRLAGGVAHDFNNLLTVILSAVEFLSEEAPAGLQADIDAIGEAARRAAGLTRQLLLFGRKQVYHPRPVEVDAVVRGIEKMLRRVIGEDVRLEIALGAEGARVQADPGRLEQVMMNLVVNARDAMSDGGRLRVETRKVSLAGAAGHPTLGPGLYVELAVSDTGTGMDPETQARIFEPFFTTKEPTVGTGLGLSTVYGIVKDAGGDITVESEPGVGTTFRIHLPELGPARLETDATPTPVAVGGVGRTVLLVEDDGVVRALASRALSRAGHRVVAASDGLEALRTAETYPEPIDLLLTDVIMPRMSGPELVERLRSRRPGLAVLYMSGYMDQEVGRRGVDEQSVDLLHKPFTPDELVRRVQSILGRAVADRE